MKILIEKDGIIDKIIKIIFFKIKESFKFTN